MSEIKKKTRRKLAKRLKKLVKRHGAETTLALVTGIVGALAAKAEVAASHEPALEPAPLPRLRPAKHREEPELPKPLIVRKRSRPEE